MKNYLFKANSETRKAQYWIYGYLILASISAIILGKDILLLGNLILIVGLLSFLFLKNEKILLIFTVLISIFHGGISEFINGTYIVLYAYTLMILSLLVNNKKLKVDKVVLVLSIITIGLAFIPLATGAVSIPVLLFSIFKRFGFLIIYVFVINMDNITIKFEEVVMKFIIYTLVINFFFTLIQFIQGNLHQDFITGLLGGGMTGILAYLFMFYIAMLSGLHYKNKIHASIYLILILIPVVYSAIAEVKIGFVTTAILIGIYFLILNKSYKSIVYMLVCGLVFINLYSIFISIYPTHDFLNQDFLERYLVEQSYGEGETINRFDFKTQIDTVVFDDGIDSIFGMGLGAGNPSEIEFLRGSLYKYDYLKFSWFTIPYLYVETGIVGTLLYIMIYMVPFIVAIRHFIKRRTLLSVVGVLMGLTNIMYLTYNAGLLDYGVSTVYWLITALIFNERNNKEFNSRY